MADPSQIKPHFHQGFKLPPEAYSTGAPTNPYLVDELGDEMVDEFAQQMTDGS